MHVAVQPSISIFSSSRRTMPLTTGTKDKIYLCGTSDEKWKMLNKPFVKESSTSVRGLLLITTHFVIINTLLLRFQKISKPSIFFIQAFWTVCSPESTCTLHPGNSTYCFPSCTLRSRTR